MDPLALRLRERLEALPPSERERLAGALRPRATAPELVAVVRTDGTGPTEDELLEQARTRLPDYMVPRSFVFADALPRTTAGKLDRRALAARVAALRAGSGPRRGADPRRGAGSLEDPRDSASTGAPTTAAEKTLAGIWASVLGSDEIFVDDDFFELGGDSLLSIRVIARAKQAGLSIEPQQFFATPTIAALAAAAERGEGAERGARGEATAAERPPTPSDPVEEAPGGEDASEVQADTSPTLPSRPDERAPLSFAQEGFWFLDRLDPGNPAYNVAVRIDLDGPLDGDRLRRSFHYVLARHDALRATVGLEDGQPVLDALPMERFELEREDLSHAVDPEAAVQARSRETARHRFDLVGGPLVRGVLCRLTPDRHALLLTFHHMVLDGESVRLVLEDLGNAYRRTESDDEGAGEATGGGGDLAAADAPAASYRDYAHWERAQWSTDPRTSSLEYWAGALADVPDRIEWPDDEPGDRDVGPGGATLTRELPRELADAVGEASRREGCTPFALLLAVYQAFLARHTGQEIVVVGTPVGHRPHPAVERAVGYFQNMLPLRGDLTGAPTFSELVARTRTTVAEALAHADAPFERIVEVVTPERDPTATPLFQTALTFRDGTRPDGWRSALDLPGVDVRAAILHNGAAKFELALEVERTEAGLTLVAEYALDRLRAETVARLLDRFEILLRAALREPDRPVWSLPVMTPDERRTTLGLWSGGAPDDAASTGVGSPPLPDPTVPELVEAIARQDPHRVAVEDEEGTLTYGELAARARELARRFRERGVGPDGLVAVGLPPSAEQVVAFLAAWKAGGAFLGLDATLPPARLRAILENAEPVLLFSDCLGDAVPPGVPVLTPAEAGPHPAPVPGTSGPPGAGAAVLEDGAPEPTDLAYVVYTSGSTGTPKGVEVEHRALANLATWHREAFSVGAEDRVAQTASPAFDASVWEVWANLAAGATLVVAPASVRSDPRALRRWLEQERITASFVSTPLAEALLPDERVPGSLRLLLTGGDRLRSYVPPHWAPSVVNCYGPAECTVVATSGPVPAEGPVRLPGIGRPIRHTRVFLLDRNGLPVPPGVAGELCLGGPGLARGYRADPGETERRFRPALFPEAAGTRLYHTGDRARFRRDGTLDFLGRLDRQVKIRGQRIELGEVEAALLAAPGVEQAVVEVREAPAGGRQLVAFASAAPGESLDEGALRSRVGRTLPSAMVPARILLLESLPLNSSGKVDRRALSTVEIPWEVGDAPEGPVEAAVASVWAEVLGLEAVGRHDDFFAVGGHSLNAISVVARLEEAFATKLPLAAFFEAPTVAGLAELLGPGPDRTAAAPEPSSARRPDVSPEPEPTEGDRHAPLSPDQARLWYLHQLDPESPAYNVPLAYRLRGRLDLAALQRALDRLVRRHEALRSTVDASEAEPVQIAQAPGPVHIEVTVLPEGAPDSVLESTLQTETRTPFDLARGPLMRVRLVGRGPEEHHLVLTLHHIVADGWSAGLLARELSDLYASEVEGSPTPAVDPPPLRYGAWCAEQRAWLESPASAGEVQFWKDRLRDTPPLDLPTDHHRPDRPSYRGRTHAFRLAREVSERLEERCRSAGVTPFVGLLAGFQAFLHRYAGQTDVAVGTIVAGRSSVESEAVVGLFANTLVVRTEVEPHLGLGDLLERVRHASVDALTHRRVPFARVVEAVQPSRDPSRNPLFQVAFILQNQEAATLDLPGLEVEAVPVETGTAKFDLTFTAQRDEDGFALYLEYATDLFEEETIERMSGHLETLLSAVAGGFEGTVGELPLVQAREEWSLVGPTAEVREEPLHDRVLGQARRSPEAPAVTAEDGTTLLYRDLESRSARIATALMARGVGAGDVVGVGLPRAPDMVAALLGILRAGAAYLPLDPEFPAPRLAHILEDAGASVLLTTEELQDRFPAGPSPVLLSSVLGGPGPGDATEVAPGASPLPDVGPEALAYLIYTSGSTGGPKGVEITHRNVGNLLDAMAERPGLDPATRLLAVTTLSFDISVLEIFGPLLVGGEVVLAATETATDGNALGRLIGRTSPTHLQATPSTWRMLLDSGWEGDRGLRALVGGEALPPELARDLSGACGEVWNMYGPTETTVWSTCGRVDGSPDPIRVGTPVANTTVYVLDTARQPTPRGVPGELYIAGAGVARGYRNRPELNAERFLPDPFGAQGPAAGTEGPSRASPDAPGDRHAGSQARMYRTGDRVRLLGDGTLEVLGRLDGQVKIHGYRIETAEVEAALEEHPAVRAAVVRAFGTGTPDARLVAFVVPDPDRTVSGSEVRRFARERLPRYMVPNMISLLDTLPLTPNGKVDRRALADPLEAGRPEAARYEPPASAAERTIVEVWSDLLPGIRVGRDDNFFELGGHSLLSIRAVAEIRRRTGRELDPRAFFFQSVEQLATGLEDDGDSR